jgi:glutaredoxin
MMVEKEGVTIKIPRVSPWAVSTLILLIILAVFLAYSPSVSPSITGKVVSPTISAEEAANRAINYINKYLLRGQGTARLISIEEENNLYHAKLSIAGRTYDSYITMDGKLLFPSAIDLTETPEVPEETQPTGAFDAPDREKPNVKFFVMSYCPFGNQAEKGLEPVFRLLGDKVEWEPHYVIYSNYASGYPDYCLDEENRYCSMHGIQELNEDVRELCMWKYIDHDLWWDFLMKVNDECNSRNVDTCWEPIAKDLGIDTDQIKTCQENEAIELLAKEVELNQKYGVRGSPTVFINDQQYNGARTPEAYKQAICSGFISPPDECSEVLSGSAASTPTGGCG